MRSQLQDRGAGRTGRADHRSASDRARGGAPALRYHGGPGTREVAAAAPVPGDSTCLRNIDLRDDDHGTCSERRQHKLAQKSRCKLYVVDLWDLGWLRGVDLNHRPLGYEPFKLSLIWRNLTPF
jgi:hypothetical protein